MPQLRAQGQPQGPWRVVIKKVRVKVGTDDDWGPAEKDTATYLKSEATVIPIRWDIAPDSIRLFLRCENPLIAPPQPRKGQPVIRFTATGATVRLDAKSHRLFIAPHAAVVTLWAHKGRALVFKHRFTAIPPPLPTIQILIPNRSSSLPAGLKWHIPLTLKAVPEINFNNFLPDDARYRVAQYTVTLLRNGVAFGAPRNVVGPQCDLGDANDFLEGDRLQIDVQLIQRMNFRGEVEDRTMQKQFNIPLLFSESLRTLPQDTTKGW